MPGFDRIAPVYDLLASLAFGPALLRAQRWAIVQGLTPDVQRILFVGGGTGVVLPDVLARCPQAEVVYVEASAAMLARAQRRLQRECPTAVARVHFHHGPPDSLPPDLPACDAVLAFFLLDLFTEPALADLIRVLGRLTVPGARWLVADFAPPQTRWQRNLLRVLYTFFRLTAGLGTQRMPDWPATLAHAGLRPLIEVRSLGGSLRAGVWQ